MFIIGGEIATPMYAAIFFIDHGKTGYHRLSWYVHASCRSCLCYRHGFSINLSATDDEYFLTLCGLCFFNSLCQWGDQLQMWRVFFDLSGMPGDPATLKRSGKKITIQRFKGFLPSHWHSPGSIFEKLRYRGQFPQQLVVLTDPVVFEAAI